MATSNRRDVELALRVSTLGQEGIARMEQQVRDLAAAGGDAAPEFNALADEIARLGTLAGQFQAFGTLAQDVEQLSAAQRTASETTATLYAETQRLATVAREMEAAEAAAKTELQAGQRALAEKKEALAALRINTSDAQKAEDSFKAAVNDSKRAILESEVAVRQLRDAYRASKAATSDAAAAEKDAEASYRSANRELARSADVLAARNEALSASHAELLAAGVATDDLTQSHLELVGALNRAGTAAESLQTTQAQQVEEERRLAAIQFETRRQLMAQADAEAKAIIADYARIEQAERERQLELQRTAQAAQEAAATIANAFRTVGTRSVADINAEIAKVRAAMETLSNTAGLSGKEIATSFSLGNARIKELQRELRAATGEVTLMDRASGALKTTLGQFAAMFTVVELAQRLGRAFFDANTQIEGLRLGLTTIYKDSNTAGRQIEFLQQTANKAGVSFGDISQAFVKFSASFQSANIPLAQTNSLFAAVTQAAGTLGLSGDKVSHILDALGQMAAKGVVSMEELRQQLGDSLPGALSLTAKGLGITDAELVKLVESGGLMARDLIPALTKSLQTMSGEVNTLSSNWQRFGNVATEALQSLGDAGGTWIVTKALQALGTAVAFVGSILLGFVEAANLTARAIGVLHTVLSGNATAKTFSDFGDQVEKSANRLRKMQEATNRSAEQLLGLGDDSKTAAGGVAAVGTAAAAATPAVQANTGAMAANSTAAAGAGAAQGSFATATEQAAAKAALAGASIVQLGVRYAEVSGKLQNNVDVAEKLVKAREIEGRSIEAVTRLTGSHRQELEASVHAAEGNLTALQALATARNAEVAALRGYIAALQEEVRLHGDPDGARQKDIEARQKKLALLDADKQKTDQAVEAAKLEIAQKQLSRQAYEDNSKAVDALRVAMENSQKAVHDLQVLELNGKATREQVIDATTRAAVAEGLYRDALKDSAAAAERNIQALQNKNLVTQASLSLDAARASSLGALAKSMGDENLATQSTITLKEIEIQRRNAQAQATAGEAAEMLRNAEAQRVALRGTKDWTSEKEAEYQRTKANAEAKRLEAEATREGSKALQQEINDLRNGVTGHNESRSAIDAETAAIREQIKAIQDKYRTVGQDPTKTADGFKKNADGSAAGTFNNNLPVDQAFRLAQGQITNLAEAAVAMQQAKNAFEDMQAFTRQSPGASSFEYQQSTTQLFTKARAEYEKLQAAAGAGSAAKPAAPGTGPGAAETTAAGQGAPRTVHIKLGGQTTAINTASQADSDSLVAFLRNLETQSRSAA